MPRATLSSLGFSRHPRSFRLYPRGIEVRLKESCMRDAKRADIQNTTLLSFVDLVAKGTNCASLSQKTVSDSTEEWEQNFVHHLC